MWHKAWVHHLWHNEISLHHRLKDRNELWDVNLNTLSFVLAALSGNAIMKHNNKKSFSEVIIANQLSKLHHSLLPALEAEYTYISFQI